jgi:Transposase IS4
LLDDNDTSDPTIDPTTRPFNLPAINVPDGHVDNRDSVSKLHGPTNDKEDNEESVQPVFSNVYDWFAVEKPTDDNMNGDIPMEKWKFLGTDGVYWESNDDLNGTKHPILEYFLASMPTATIKRILMETNKKLTNQQSELLDIAELLRFFGICILVTQFEFESPQDLWLVNTGSKFISPANFVLTGMLCNQFKEIWSLMTLSAQDYHWMLVDDFVEDYNKHRRVRFCPSEKVCYIVLLQY